MHIIKSLIIVCCFYLSTANAESKIMIITKGSGGDYFGALILSDRLKTRNVETVIYNLSNDSLSEINTSNIAKIILLGQGAINDLVTNCKASDFYNKEVFVYSHLYNQRIVDFIQKIANKNKNKVTIYVTKSQLHNFEINLSDNIQIVSSFLVMNSYQSTDLLKTEAINNLDLIKQILTKQTIHLGGSYYNSGNVFVPVNSNNITEALKKLPLDKKQASSVLLHPRTFMDCKAQDGSLDLQKAFQRINSIYPAITNDATTGQMVNFFLPKFIWQQLGKFVQQEKLYNIFPAPNYNAILYTINEAKSLHIKIGKQFISADQYNAFANIKVPVYPFLLQTNDQEQKDYISSYRKLLKNNEQKLGSTYILDHIVDALSLTK